MTAQLDILMDRLRSVEAEIVYVSSAGRTPPADAAVLARQAFLASRTNFFLSVPLLFFMATSYHYVIFGR